MVKVRGWVFFRFTLAKYSQTPFQNMLYFSTLPNYFASKTEPTSAPRNSVQLDTIMNPRSAYEWLSGLSFNQVFQNHTYNGNSGECKPPDETSIKIVFYVTRYNNSPIKNLSNPIFQWIPKNKASESTLLAYHKNTNPDFPPTTTMHYCPSGKWASNLGFFLFTT